MLSQPACKQVAEDFVGRDDHLVFRSIVFDTEGLTDQDLMEAADKSLMEQKIRKVRVNNPTCHSNAIPMPFQC